MKSETINIFIIAKSLFDKAQELCIVDDKYITSTGLLILQDALELVLYACLIELGIDQEKAIENFTFDQLIGELNKKGKRVNKSGTLKALNKQRVLIKHYGQLAEPETVKNLFNIARESIDALLHDVVGRNLQEVMLHDLIHKGEIKDYFKKAAQFIRDQKYFMALIEIRKAIFTEIEEEYSIEKWSDYEYGEERSYLWTMLFRGGGKAPIYTRNKKWIEENVREPYDFIQFDHDRLRLDLLEWGVSTQDFWNLWRLTPKVFRFKESKAWIVKNEPGHIIEGATEGNAKYCLDRALSLIIKKQGHFDLSRSLNTAIESKTKVRIKNDQPLFKKASTNSQIIAEVKKDDVFDLDSIIQGFDGKEKFANIFKISKDPPRYQSGYILHKFIEIIE
jgi:hypothetical protein